MTTSTRAARTVQDTQTRQRPMPRRCSAAPPWRPPRATTPAVAPTPAVVVRSIWRCAGVRVQSPAAAIQRRAAPYHDAGEHALHQHDGRAGGRGAAALGGGPYPASGRDRRGHRRLGRRGVVHRHLGGLCCWRWAAWARTRKAGDTVSHGHQAASMPSRCTPWGRGWFIRSRSTSSSCRTSAERTAEERRPAAGAQRDAVNQ